MIIRFKRYLHYKMLSFFKPEIIGSPKRFINNIGNNVGISNTTHISNKNNNLKIGNNVFIGHFNYIDAYNDKIEIGNKVQITNYVQVLTHSTHNSIRFHKINELTSEELSDLNNIDKVFIGEETYIGPHTVIMPGTVIGKKAIVGAFSYVKGEFPDYAIIRGIPAKIVGDTRDIDNEILNKFQKS